MPRKRDRKALKRGVGERTFINEENKEGRGRGGGLKILRRSGMQGGFNDRVDPF